MDIFKVFTNDELLERAFKVAVDHYKHQDYKRTVEVAKWCKQMNTGDDQREILIKYRPKESEKQKDQRVRVYNSRTQEVSNKVRALYNEVHRSDDIIDNIKYEGANSEESKNRVGELSEFVDKFDGLRSARSYLTRRNKYNTFLDPNAWIVVEFEGDGDDRSIFPFEISSAQAHDFHVERGITQYVTACIERSFETKDGNSIKNQKYTLYAAEINIDIIEEPENKSNLIGWKDPEGYTLVSKKNKADVTKQFWYKIYETENSHCPGTRFGFIDDIETNCRTFISPLHLAEKTFQRLIWRTSTLDISHACHGFYKLMMYTERCNHREVVNGKSYTCDNGYIGGSKCKSCKGTGKKMHLSDQDVVMYLIENRGDKITPLSDMIHYATIPTDLIKEQKEEVDAAFSDCLSTIFNENIFDKSILANTATGIHYNWRSVNNRLMDYADHDADMYRFIIRTIAMIQNQDDGLQVEYGYPSDFKLESVQELLDERSTAVGSNAPADIISSIDMKILSKQHRDNPEYVQMFKAKEKFKPLRTKNSDERMMILQSLPDLHPQKILYQYHDEIFDEIFTLRPNFAEIPYIKQKELVDKTVDQWIDREKEARPTPQLSFGDTSSPGDDDEDGQEDDLAA